MKKKEVERKKSFFDEFNTTTSETTQIQTTKSETSPEKEVRLHKEESDKNNTILKKYGNKIYNSVWYGEEVRVRTGGIIHNMKANVSEWDTESVDEQTLLKLLDLYTKPGDVVLDPFAGYLNSGKVIYSSGRKLIANDINSNYIGRLRADYDKYIGMHTDTPEVTFLTGDADKSLEAIKTESVDMVLTVLPTKERHLNGNYPYNLEKITNEIQRLLKKEKMAVFILRDESKGFKETLTFLDVVLPLVKAKFNLQFINVLVLDDPEDEDSGIENGSISLQWHKMFYKNHYYIIGVEKI